MALIKCPECGKEISDKAISCPNCGAVVKKKFCHHCGASIDSDCVVCPKCGKQVENIGSNNPSISASKNAVKLAFLFFHDKIHDKIIAKPSMLLPQRYHPQKGYFPPEML